MWIETEKNPFSFTVEGGGDGYLEQVGWHIQRAGGYFKDYNVIAKTNENIIVITKYIKFSKMLNPSSLSKNMEIEEKWRRCPMTVAGVIIYLTCQFVGSNTIPNELISSGWLQIKNQYQTLWKMATIH